MQPNQNDDQPTQPTPSSSSGVRDNARDAAAELMRSQIDRIYDEQTAPADRNAESEAKDNSPYQQTHSEQADHQAVDTSNAHWKQYHTAWQSYYQQYYERYYLAQIQKRQASISSSGGAQSTAPQPAVVASKPISRDQAVDELRDKLISQVKESSRSVRKSRHFMPIVAALVVGLAFALLQYNRLIIAQVKAYVSPGSISAENIVIDPTVNTKVGPAAKIVIPKINVDAPVVYDVPSIDEHVVQEKLKSGVVHYPIPGASSVPGQKGNTVILGHSSNDVFDDGGYKFVFVQLDKLEKGDTFYLNYQGTRYTYSVTDKKEILPTQVSTLVVPADKPIATLVTCTPVGTALRRLVVTAEQISPDPSGATASATTDSSKPLTPIAGNSPTFLERLFGGGN